MQQIEEDLQQRVTGLVVDQVEQLRTNLDVSIATSHAELRSLLHDKEETIRQELRVMVREHVLHQARTYQESEREVQLDESMEVGHPARNLRSSQNLRITGTYRTRLFG